MPFLDTAPPQAELPAPSFYTPPGLRLTCIYPAHTGTGCLWGERGWTGRGGMKAEESQKEQNIMYNPAVG